MSMHFWGPWPYHFLLTKISLICGTIARQANFQSLYNAFIEYIKTIGVFINLTTNTHNTSLLSMEGKILVISKLTNKSFSRTPSEFNSSIISNMCDISRTRQRMELPQLYNTSQRIIARFLWAYLTRFNNSSQIVGYVF